MINLDAKLETWKNKLLDLGKRNSLLNYRDTRRSNLRIKKPEIFDLWDSFVLKEEPLIFPLPEDVMLIEDDDLAETPLETGGVVTNQSVKEQQKTLNNIRTKAKTAIEEQGINLLYLSFGFVRWTESENSDQTFDAPLILVPVALKLESITSPFVLTLHEDEIVVNPTLIYKLENDYGIKLPEFNSEGSLSDYFSEVSEIISKSHWEIIPEVGLGLLSFLKINMYRDLEQHKEKILQNPIVRALGGDTTALQYDLSEFENVDHDVIETAVNKRRRENQTFEEFFNEDRPDAFFIKNLENVQGDERDTIIFSIGYAKDASGKMHMNFGPLSKSGGERRLNVAITRAKYNVKLVGSIMPTDIETERINAEGPKLLRGYIDFAIHGPSVLENEITDSDIVENDSPFEAAVYNFLDRKGYKLGTQVGCSGFRIDMAVKHPSLSGRYVLGIECDGATYHSARTARERDRLRQDVLEGMGWKIYRIWSTDWIKDPNTEGERLLEAVDKAISEYVEDVPTTSKSADNAEPEAFLSVEKKEITAAQAKNPYGFTTPKATNFGSLPRDRNGYLQMKDCIELLVKNEFPIHYDLLCQKLASLLGREKATKVVRREVDYALQGMRTRILRKGDFFYPVGYTDVPVRTLNGRSIKYISIDELASAMYTISQKCIGTTREALIIETVRAYGFTRSGSSITNAMNQAYDQLLSDNKIHEVDGKVAVNCND